MVIIFLQFNTSSYCQELLFCKTDLDSRSIYKIYHSCFNLFKVNLMPIILIYQCISFTMKFYNEVHST